MESTRLQKVMKIQDPSWELLRVNYEATHLKKENK